MSYVEIVGIIMFIVGIFAIIFPIQYAIIFIAGIFCKSKKFPESKEKLKYGVIICARNEEGVIGNLIKSISKCNYPKDKIDIFVIAHNCTDKTAEVARENGAIVYEYNNENERTKGYALKQIFKLIEQDYGIKSYDGYHVFDADNVLDSEYFNKMNDAFLYYNKENAITSFRNAKNFGTNAQTGAYGICYIACCSLESNGRMALGISARVLGSGFLVSSEMVKDGWNIVILSDDTDFTIEQVLAGKKVMYCDEAMYYDEHPTTFKAMWRQRLRWAKGTLIVCKKRLKNLLKTVFTTKKKKIENGQEQKLLKGSSFDLICVILPIGAIGFCILLLNIILLALSPLFNCDVGLAFKNWAIFFAVSALLGILGLMFVGLMAFIKEKNRIKNVPLRKKIAAVLYWPFFGLLLVPLQIVAMFKKDFAWTQIVHSDSSSHETFNDQQVEEGVSSVATETIEVVPENTTEIKDLVDSKKQSAVS